MKVIDCEAHPWCLKLRQRSKLSVGVVV